jgi:hypothetical protein
MSYDLQAEGLNGVNVQTSIIAGHDWEPNVEEGGGSPVSTVLFVSGIALDNPSPANVDAMIGRGRLFGNGLTGFGGDKGGTGVIGVAGGVVPADGGVGPVTGQNAGVYGTGVAGMVSTPAVGVIGQGGPTSTGVVGQAGSGNADGVRGFGSGSFSGVAGFGDPEGSGAGVFGAGKGVAAPGIRGIGAGGPNSVPGDPCGVYGQAGEGTANGVEGHGSLEGAGVAGFGDPSGSGPGVVGTGRGSGAPGVKGIGAGGVDTVSISACGVYGQAGSGNSNGVEGRGSGNFAGVAGFGDVSLRATGGIGVFAVGGAPAPASGQPGGPGVYAVGFGGPGYTPLNQTAGVYGVGGASNGPGILGQGGSVAADGVQGSSGSGNGVSGQSGSGVGVRASSGSATGLVAEGNIGLIASTIAPAGTAGQFDGNVVVNGDFTVFGKVKSVAVPFPDGSHRRLYCMESPENWFEDFGFGELSNGEARVPLDPGFSAIVEGEGYHVFITEYEGNNALYVTQRTSAGFVVRATAQTATGTFSYRVVAKRKDIRAPRFEEVQVSGEGPLALARPADLCSRQASAA